MAYIALYRKWRPLDFNGLVGQEHISTTFRNAISSGRIAHAYLFAGPRGTGKTSTAKILAKALNCDSGPTPQPCNECSNCQRITAGTSMDVFEIDAASNRGIDEIRDLREAVKFAPVDGRYKVYIIDEVHMLTTEAFNALLKTLEEPPAHVVFILATTEPHKIPATIHSRCQRYDFRRFTIGEIEGHLKEVAANSKFNVAPAALRLIAAHADGGMRDALSILDQCTALGKDEITAAMVQDMLGLVGHEGIWKLTEAMADRDAARALMVLDELIAKGKDVRQILIELALHGRSLMLYKAAPDAAAIEMYSDDREVLAGHCEKFSHNELVKMIQGLQAAASEAKWSPEPRITAEMALLEVCRRAADGDLAGLQARVAALEAALAGAGPTRARPEQAPPHAPARSPASGGTAAGLAGKKAEPAAVRTEKKPPSAPLPAPPPAPEPGSEPAQCCGDPAAAWEEVLRELVAGGKRSVHACVSQGKLVELSESRAVVEFTSPFAKERTEKEDYRQLLEKTMAQITGRSVRLSCVIGARPGKERQVRPAAPKAAAPAAAEHPALDQAIKLFGGKVIKEDDHEEE